jgi:hypothetical protein
VEPAGLAQQVAVTEEQFRCKVEQLRQWQEQPVELQVLLVQTDQQLVLVELVAH